MELDLQSLVSKSVDEARELAKAAGLVTRTVEPGGVVTADYQQNRITLVASQGRVVELPVRG